MERGAGKKEKDQPFQEMGRVKTGRHQEAKFKDLQPSWAHAMMSRKGFEIEVHTFLEAQGIRISFQKIRVCYMPLFLSNLMDTHPYRTHHTPAAASS